MARQALVVAEVANANLVQTRAMGAIVRGRHSTRIISIVCRLNWRWSKTEQDMERFSKGGAYTYGNSHYLPSVFVIADMHISCALVEFVVASRVIGGLHPVIPSGVFPCPFDYIHMS
jgi:hypothetical protein